MKAGGGIDSKDQHVGHYIKEFLAGRMLYL